MDINKKANVISQKALGGRGVFYVGGSYKGEPGQQYMCDQIFVEMYVPEKIRHQYPLIFFHGAGQTNVNWLVTPDGRMGWADYFVEQGFVVYLVEQPARGRSAYHPAIHGEQIYHSIEAIEARFTSADGDWPQAKKHTQWPGGNGTGDAVFLDFAKSQAEYLPSNKLTQQLVLACAEELLSVTGPSILLTHSQAGPFGWSILDAYPAMIKGIVALEPSGPPFGIDLSNPTAGNYGITELPLHFSPAVSDPEEFRLELMKAPDFELRDGWIMEEVHQLPHFADTPILLLTGEASYHAQYDHLISHFFTQVGVSHDFVRLETVGIRGNGHMMMLEKNNLEIADFINDWICSKITVF